MTYRDLVYYLIEMNTEDLDLEANVAIVGLPSGARSAGVGTGGAGRA